MTTDEKYMHRCLQLARNGKGFTKPNPMVGAVIVHNDTIIGEGFHSNFGNHHAEVIAINSVKKKLLLQKSTIYVSLEPCSHYGKTPPCADLIVKSGIRRVVIAVKDPNPQVCGKGIAILENAGIEVVVGILESEASNLNRIFFCNQKNNRPYILLKWAQSKDGFIDHERDRNSKPTIISNEITKCINHKTRTHFQGIMVGTQTVIKDNPQLTVRNWFGNNPTRITIDRQGIIPKSATMFNDNQKTIVFCQESYQINNTKVRIVPIDFEGDTIQQMINYLYKEKIYSIIVEGGSKLLSSFISKKLWDEAMIEISDQKINRGVQSPVINGETVEKKQYKNAIQLHIKNK